MYLTNLKCVVFPSFLFKVYHYGNFWNLALQYNIFYIKINRLAWTGHLVHVDSNKITRKDGRLKMMYCQILELVNSEAGGIWPIEKSETIF